MGELAAVRVAVDLLHLPSRARALKCGQLPDGLEMLLRIAAGDEEIVAAAAKSVPVKFKTGTYSAKTSQGGHFKFKIEGHTAADHCDLLLRHVNSIWIQYV